jgi:hypothetical protein
LSEETEQIGLCLQAKGVGAIGVEGCPNEVLNLHATIFYRECANYKNSFQTRQTTDTISVPTKAWLNKSAC